MEFLHKDYLGDGVYALFDGYAIWLRANDPDDPTGQICIEPSVLRSLNRFNTYCETLMKDNKQC